MNLIKSPVVFNSEDHTYFLGDKQLSGITSVIHRHICPSKYDGIPKHILDKAAERGTLIHETCELVDDLHIESEMQEAINYENILFSIVITALISGMTIGGKAAGKEFAMKKCTRIVYATAKVMLFFGIGKSKNKRR